MRHNPDLSSVSENTDSTVMQPKPKQSANNIRSLPGKCPSHLEIRECKTRTSIYRKVGFSSPFAVNCVEYLANEEAQIPVDEVFFYRYGCVSVSVRY